MIILTKTDNPIIKIINICLTGAPAINIIDKDIRKITAEEPRSGSQAKLKR